MKATNSSEALGHITTAQCKSPKDVSDYYHFQVSENIKMFLQINFLEKIIANSGED
jgi:hypothetical protein